jgi:rhodanese-related sulfurtransferase
MSLCLFTFKNEGRRTLFRILTVAFIALAVGVVVNQLHRNGIQWRVLILSIPMSGLDKDWNYVSTDSCFSAFLSGEAVFVDIRSRQDFEIDHVPDAISVPFFDFFNDIDRIETWDKDDVTILYDLERHSKTARLMARQLVKEGFQHVSIMRGGFVEWLDRMYPVEQGPA